MTEDEAISIVTKVYSNKITAGEVYSIIYNYCISKGKSVLATKTFIQTATVLGIDIELLKYIVNHYIEEYQLTLLTNKEGKFIKVLKNEEINCKTICHSKESGTECQSSCNQEEQTCR